MTIEFQTDTNNSNRLQPSVQNPKMTKFLIEKGIVKNETQAFYVLLGISIICFALSIYIFWGYVIGFPVKVSPEQIRQQQEFEQRMLEARQNADQNQNTDSTPGQ